MAAIKEVVDWEIVPNENTAHHPVGPQGRDARRTSLSFQELQAAIARWRDSLGGGSPLTTKGDLYTFSTVETRLPVGTNGQILSANAGEATGLQWIDGVSPAGADTQIQFNNSGSFGADSQLTFADPGFTPTLTIGDTTSVSPRLDFEGTATSSQGIYFHQTGTERATIRYIDNAGGINDILRLNSDGVVEIAPGNIVMGRYTNGVGLELRGSATGAGLKMQDRTAKAWTDEAGYGQIYVKDSDSHLYYVNGTGTEYQISGAAVAAAGANNEIQFNNSGVLGADPFLSVDLTGTGGQTPKLILDGTSGTYRYPTIEMNYDANDYAALDIYEEGVVKAYIRYYASFGGTDQLMLENMALGTSDLTGIISFATRTSGGSRQTRFQINRNGPQILQGGLEIGDAPSAPHTDRASYGQIFLRSSDNLLIFRNSAGTEYDLTGTVPPSSTVVSGTSPYFGWIETDATLDQGYWRATANGEQLILSVFDDAEVNSWDFLTIDRSGTGAGVVADNVQLRVDFLPMFTDAYDLGSTSLRWQALYLENSIDLSGASPDIAFNQDTATLDQKFWWLEAASESLYWEIYTDSFSDSYRFFEVQRSGTGASIQVDTLDLTAVTDITLNTAIVNLGTMSFDADQVIGVGQDNYVLTYDNGTGLISLEAAAGGGIGGTIANDQIAVGAATADEIEGADTFALVSSSQRIPGGIRFTERADHIETPTATFAELWVKNDAPNTLVFTDDAGTDHVLAGGGASGRWELISSTSITAVANVDVTWDETRYSIIKVIIEDAQVGTDNVDVEVQMGHTNGGTIITATSYTTITNAGTTTWSSASAQDHWLLTGAGNAGNAAGEYFSATMELTNFKSSNHSATLDGVANYHNTIGNILDTRFMGSHRANANAIDTLRFQPSSGNWAASGTIKVYGFVE